VRATVGVWTYASLVYGIAAIALGAFAAGVRAPLLGHRPTDWAVMASLAAGPMLIGHTGMNYALKHFRATTVNVAALGEPVGATIIAWLVPAINETPPASAIVGGVVVLAGIVLAFSDKGQAARAR
jgi:drug/metabolite transporter (DMT)-like permease